MGILLKSLREDNTKLSQEIKRLTTINNEFKICHKV